MTYANTPGLYGLHKSNQDFTKRKSWGKNIFNNAFPIALVCFMHDSDVAPVYLRMGSRGTVEHSYLPANQLFNIAHLADAHFTFEHAYSPYAVHVVNRLPSIDLVVQDTTKANVSVRPLEIKLTALPDETTCNERDEQQYGSELVIRRDTILYIALNLVARFAAIPPHLIAELIQLDDSDWREPHIVKPLITPMTDILQRISTALAATQSPLLLQPIWKTHGKSPLLADQCLDAFIWSDLALIHVCCREATQATSRQRVSRIERAVVWIARILIEYAQSSKINFGGIVTTYGYGAQNDKAFALSGQRTRTYMRSAELTTPRVPKGAIKHIIVGGGQELLSPERRFDAVLVNTPELFS